MKNTIILFALILGMLSLNVQAQQSAHDQINQVYNLFSQAYKLKTAKILEQLYDEDCAYLQPSKEAAIQDHSDAMSNFESLFSSQDNLEIEFKFNKRNVAGDIAYDSGYYKLIRTNAEGKKTESYGKFLMVLKKGKDMMWRIQADSYSPTTKQAYNSGKSY